METGRHRVGVWGRRDLRRSGFRGERVKKWWRDAAGSYRRTGKRLGQAAGCLQVPGEGLAGSRGAHRKRRKGGASLGEGHGDWGCE